MVYIDLLSVFVLVELKFVLFVSSKLYGSIWYDSDHGCRVPSPQHHKTFILVCLHQEL